MTKYKVLFILKKAEDYMSGQEIGRTLSISRAAVNSAVASLRSEGYIISAVTNKGYKLINSPDNLNEGEIMSVVSPKAASLVKCLDTVGSTNSYLQHMAQYGAEDGSIVIANEQTKGRGRFSRPFESPKDKGIYMSVLMRLNDYTKDSSQITAWTATAVAGAIEKVCDITVGIKWVNDIILNNKKICGILTEMYFEAETAQQQNIIIGIGINVNEKNEDFTMEVQDTATSVFSETGKKINRAELAGEIINAIDKMRRDWDISNKSEYLEFYRKRCVNIGRAVRYNKGNVAYEGIAENIDDDFKLIVRLSNDKKDIIASGEVSVRGLYGYI